MLRRFFVCWEGVVPLLVYCAPMEGLTGYLFRQVHHRFFPGVDKYFTPFLSPTQEHVFPRKARQEVDPGNNQGLRVVPQILTRRAEDFIWMARELAEMGYREVDLNLGCPSGTVVAKGKGAALLARPEDLDRFLDQIYSALDLDVSIKTRLGLQDPAEFPALLAVFARYPVSELIVHPRVRADFYRGPVNMESFDLAAGTWERPLCYNGDLFTPEDCARLAHRSPRLDRLMLGRGLMADPALAAKLQGGPAADKASLRAFHDQLFDAYTAAFASRRNAMMRMKELWSYLIHLFAGEDRAIKDLRKARDPEDYRRQVDRIFREMDLLPQCVPPLP